MPAQWATSVFPATWIMCINIRTVVVKKHQAFIQAGAGIVADSNPNTNMKRPVIRLRP